MRGARLSCEPKSARRDKAPLSSPTSSGLARSLARWQKCAALAQSSRRVADGKTIKRAPPLAPRNDLHILSGSSLSLRKLPGALCAAAKKLDTRAISAKRIQRARARRDKPELRLKWARVRLEARTRALTGRTQQLPARSARSRQTDRPRWASWRRLRALAFAGRLAGQFGADASGELECAKLCMRVLIGA